MGLPAKYEHPQYGLCLTLHAALAHLRAAGVPHRHDRDAIYVTLGDGQEISVRPLTLTLGKMYAVRALQGETLDA